MNNVTDKTSSPVRLFAGFRTYAYRFAIVGAILGAINFASLMRAADRAGFDIPQHHLLLALALAVISWLAQTALWAAMFTAGQNWINKQRNVAISVAVFVASGFVLQMIWSSMRAITRFWLSYGSWFAE